MSSWDGFREVFGILTSRPARFRSIVTAWKIISRSAGRLMQMTSGFPTRHRAARFGSRTSMLYHCSSVLYFSDILFSVEHDGCFILRSEEHTSELQSLRHLV